MNTLSLTHAMLQFIAISTLILATLCSTQASEVLVRAWADESYIRPTDGSGTPLPETCLFLKGQYHGSAYEEEPAIPFEEVVTALRNQLERRDYFMATDSKQVDFILVIHWGQTTPEENPFDDFSSDIDDPLFNDNGVTDQERKKNAQLIGIKNLDHLHVHSMKRERLEEAITQDRYFINVIALSVAELKAREEGAPPPKPKWTTQLSVPTGRTDEKTALASMVQAGGSFFGDDIKDIGFVRPDVKRGIVTLGELEYLDWDDDGSEEDEDSSEAP